MNVKNNIMTYIVKQKEYISILDFGIDGKDNCLPM